MQLTKILEMHYHSSFSRTFFLLGLIAAAGAFLSAAAVVVVVVVVVAGFVAVFSSFLPQMTFQMNQKSSHKSASDGRKTQKMRRLPIYFLPTLGPK